MAWTGGGACGVAAEGGRLPFFEVVFAVSDEVRSALTGRAWARSESESAFAPDGGSASPLAAGATSLSSESNPAVSSDEVGTEPSARGFRARFFFLAAGDGRCSARSASDGCSPSSALASTAPVYRRDGLGARLPGR